MVGWKDNKKKDSLLKPLLHVIQHVHGNGVDHGHFPMIIFEHEDHVEVFQMKLDTLEMYQFDILQRYDKWRLDSFYKICSVIAFLPKESRELKFRRTHSTRFTRQPDVGCSRTVLRNGTPGKPNSRKGASNSISFRVIVSTWNMGTARQNGVHSKIKSSSSSYFFAKRLEGGFQLVPELSFGLFGCQIVPVVHVLVFAEIRGDFSDFGVELQIVMLSLSEHNSILLPGSK